VFSASKAPEWRECALSAGRVCAVSFEATHGFTSRAVQHHPLHLPRVRLETVLAPVGVPFADPSVDDEADAIFVAPLVAARSSRSNAAIVRMSGQMEVTANTPATPRRERATAPTADPSAPVKKCVCVCVCVCHARLHYHVSL
jgi:hypothetical protein